MSEHLTFGLPQTTGWTGITLVVGIGGEHWYRVHNTVENNTVDNWVAPDAGSRVMNTPSPVTTDDIRVLGGLLCDGVVRLPSRRWNEPAGALSWTRWETTEHLADDLLVYAATLAAPTYSDHIPFETTRRREGAPNELVHCRIDSGASGLAAVIESATNLFVAVVDATAPEVIVEHVYGRTGPQGFTAMAAVELLVHGHDIFANTEVSWIPDSTIIARCLVRLFPDVDATSAPDNLSTLLWATGRTELPGRPRRSEWRWYN